MPPRLPVRSPCRLSLGIAAALALSACRAVPVSLGATGPAATAATDGIFGGISARFTEPRRETNVRVARRLITLAMLTPSRVFDDTAAWHQAPSANTRHSAWHGRTTPGGYRFSSADAAAPPARPGDGRHLLHLRRTSDDSFEWHTTTDFGIGDATPRAIASLPVVWIAAGERAGRHGALDDLHAWFPRSTRAWGQLFTIESLTASPARDSSWLQRIVITLHPDRAARAYPAFGAWLAKYVSPMRVRVQLRDDTHTWFAFTFAGDTLGVTLRSRGGRLLPLEGGDAPMPDSLSLDVDASARFRAFRVGFRDLRARFVTVRDTAERGWAVTFDREPDWQLPLLTEQMIRSPLRRPFTGGGSTFRITAKSDPSIPQTVLARTLHVPVRESAILRFLARLVNTGIGDYVEGADRQTNEWLAAAFGALHADAIAILEPPKTQTPPR